MPGGASTRIGVVGAGLIGGSIIKAAARAAGDPAAVVVCDTHASTRAALAAAGHTVADGPAALARIVDLAFVAVSPTATPAVAAEMLDAAPRVIVSDAASVKEPVLAGVTARVDAAALARFVPGHPLAGRESRGWEHADPNVLSGCTWAICPTGPNAPVDAPLTVIECITRMLGARVIVVDAHDHDVALAHTSHMPHVLAGALMRTAAAEAPALRYRLSGGALRDGTRVAAANPELWPDILAGNAVNTVAAIDAVIARLTQVRDVLADGRRDELARIWADGAHDREALTRARWSGHERSAEMACDPSLDALRDIGCGGDLILRVVRTEPALTLEVSRP